jgi:zinc protease
VQTIEQFKPPTKDELERAKAAYAKNLETLLNSPDRVGIALSEYAAMGDWRMLFVHRDRVAALTTDEVARVAGKYFKASNRTLVEYVPTERPDRSEVPLPGNIEPVVKAYKGSEGVVQGEAFDASPKNLEARTKRVTLPSGAKVGVLAKKTRGETVSIYVMLKYGAEKSLMNLGAAPDLAAKMLLRGTTTRTRQQVTDEFDRLHAEVSIGARPQTVVARVEVRRPQLDATLDLLADCLKNPRFDAREFELLRREELTRLEQSKDEPDAIGFTAMQRLQTAQYSRGHAAGVSDEWDSSFFAATAACSTFIAVEL